MPFISEELIDAIATELDEQPENYEPLVHEFQANQPELMAFILSEDTLFLTPEERDHLLYLSLVIWAAVRRNQPELAPVNSEKIGEAEDANWAKLEGLKVKTFRERLDIFFEKYPQEDLLAFVEDALIPDDDSPITKEGREALFIALKTVIDVIAI